LMTLAYAAYVVLFAAVVELANVANLLHSFFWVLVVMLMLVGYLLAPRFIWNLCVGTHEVVLHDEPATEIDVQPSQFLGNSVVNTFHQPSKEKAL